MKLRILVFEDEASVRRPICTYLRAQGYDVLDFPSPVACALAADPECVCPGNLVCADLIITDMNMPGMTGLQLVRMLNDKGCYASPNSRIVISSSLTPEQEAEFLALGCQFLPKPFQLNELRQLVQRCEESTSPGRKLVPIEDLWKTMRNH